MEANPLYCDLRKRTLSETLGNGNFSFPALTQGDSLTIGLRFSQSINGTPVEVSRVVHSVRATIGAIDARPETGEFALTIGPDAATSANTTASLTHNASAAKVQAAINALSAIVALYGAATVTQHAGSWLIVFASATEAVEIAATSNSLFPVSLVRVRPYASNDVWTHELRLIQAPVALSNTFARIVPPAPTITRVREGGSNGTAEWNEIQRLDVPPSFVGNYQVRRGFFKTPLLSIADGAEEIAAAIATLGDATEDETFSITNPILHAAHIEFSGEAFAGIAQDLLAVDVFDAPEGDVVFTIPLTAGELAVALRKAAEIKLPIEIEAEIEDESDADTIRTIKLYSGEVTIKRELGYSELAVAQNRDWLRGPKRRDYIPFDESAVITGSQHYTTTLGDGVATSFVVDHNLGTDALHITLRENASGGAVLVNGTDYAVALNDVNQLTITVVGDPVDTAALAVVITTAGPISAFSAHTQAIETITGLRDELDALGERVQTLETLIPSGALETPASASAEETIAEWTLMPRFEVFPARVPIPAVASLAALDLTKLPRKRGLFPAVHDAAAEALPDPVPTPSAIYAGNVYQNQTGADVTLIGGDGMKSVVLKDDEYAACDGRAWYKVVQYSTSETSFYPYAFERQLFELHIDAKQLRLKREFRLDFGFEACVFDSDSRVQWAVVLEFGVAAQASTPATTGVNLSGMTWAASPVLDHRIILTSQPSIRTFGASVRRALVDSVDTLTASTFVDGLEESATPPTENTFGIRGKLARFDTEDGISSARGFVALRGLNVGIAGAEVGKGWIR